jgi:hypothetical protein
LQPVAALRNLKDGAMSWFNALRGRVRIGKAKCNDR